MLQPSLGFHLFDLIALKRQAWAGSLPAHFPIVFCKCQLSHSQRRSCGCEQQLLIGDRFLSSQQKATKNKVPVQEDGGSILSAAESYFAPPFNSLEAEHQFKGKELVLTPVLLPFLLKTSFQRKQWPLVVKGSDSNAGLSDFGWNRNCAWPMGFLVPCVQCHSLSYQKTLKCSSSINVSDALTDSISVFPALWSCDLPWLMSLCQGQPWSCDQQQHSLIQCITGPTHPTLWRTPESKLEEQTEEMAQ